MLEHNHYERATAAWLRARGTAFVPVHEGQRAHLGGSQPAESVKSPDFLVLGTGGRSYVVDVKGRRFPAGKGRRPCDGSVAQPGPWEKVGQASGSTGGRNVFECWVTLDDLDGLARWTTRLGKDWSGLFLFAYWLADGLVTTGDMPDLYEFHGRQYLFRGALLEEFRAGMRVRSPRWATVDLPVRESRRVIRPLHSMRGLESLGEVGRRDCARLA